MGSNSPSLEPPITSGDSSIIFIRMNIVIFEAEKPAMIVAFKAKMLHFAKLFFDDVTMKWSVSGLTL